MWDNIPGTHQSIAENAMRIESERRARELEAATIAGFVGGLQTALRIINNQHGWYETHMDFIEDVESDINDLINNPETFQEWWDKRYD